jgi:ATP-dependent Lon protease
MHPEDDMSLAEPVMRLPRELPILPLPDGVAFPYSILPLTATDVADLRLIDEAVTGDKIIGLLAVKDPTSEPLGPEDLYGIGTAAGIVKLYRFPGDVVRLSLRGLARFRVVEYTGTEPFLTARIETLDTVWPESDVEVEAWRKNIELQLRQIVELSPSIPDEIQLASLLSDPERLGFLAAGGIESNTRDKQKVLEEDNIARRLKILSGIMSREIKILKLRNKIQSQVRSEIEKDQKEYYLKEQMKAIQKELGGSDGENPEARELREKLDEKELPDEVRAVAIEEIDRLVRMHPGAPEAAVSRTYVEWILQLPWLEGSEDILDIDRATGILEEDHYDLKDVKERVLEFLAVRMLNRESREPILCFVGPPGVGKTSMGRSIARSLGRKFHRLSLGGVHDEAEIRGHRKTYIGAMPGRIIHGLKEVGTNNPVFMLDEVDKVGRDFRGDPTSALLEVLDPEQNFSFRDNYLNVPFDLSHVKFITTANTLDTIPPPLIDRMEIIRIPGYTEEEKLEIARCYLVRKQLANSGLTGRNLRFVKSGLRAIVKSYTREAGVRELERQIGKISRKVAMKVAAGGDSLAVVSKANVHEFLGAPRFISEVASRKPQTGIATGLAWTPAGGEILFVETSVMEGKGNLVLTGQLGDVMKESARAALSWIREHAERYGIGTDFLTIDIHLHVPAGATPKDGPSAGVAIVVSMLSALSGMPVRPDIAVTGEITLHGKVMPVGGIKEKVLGARAAGIGKIVLPQENMKDLEEVPDELRESMWFVPVTGLGEAIPHFLMVEKKGKVH